MPTPAIMQLVNALAAQLAPTGYTIIKNRSRDDEVEQGERPAVNIRVVEQAFEPQEQASWVLHVCAIDLDLWSDSDAAETLDEKLAEMAATVMQAVAADRTLGIGVSLFEEQSLSTDLDSVPELGVAVFGFQANFGTPRGDFFTLI